ncbi:MAG: site-2 protease family protein [Candidatus Micrarchaeota archaeon]|nr:site-2 protease family protein [Candidatus Micrarchaeota archaeon]
MAKPKKLRKPSERRAITAAALLASILILYYLIELSTLPVLQRGIIAVVALVIASRVIIVTNNFRQIFGAYLFGGKAGINFVDSLSRHHPKLWNAFADWGLVLSFGLASYFLFRKQISRRMLAFGMVSIFAIVYLVLPSSAIAFQFVNLPQITSHISSAPSSGPSASVLTSPAFYAINAVLLFGGFSLFILSTLVYAGLSIIYSLLVFAQSLTTATPNYGAINSQVPGVAPLLPGITIPLFAGIATLAILLIVHEFSHGILARVANVKLKEIGILLLGVIPIGAYVEPDEKQIKKLSKEKQSRILIAGVAANIATSIIAFVLLFLLITYVLPSFVTTKVFITATAPNSPSFNIIPSGSQVLAWNGHPVSNLSSLEAAASSTPFARVVVNTSKGNYSLLSNATGKIGVSLSQTSGPINTLGGSIVYFAYIVLSLSFLFNFLIGVVNLLPVPAVDGWQVFQLVTKDKGILAALAWITVLAVLANILPWFWTH